MALKGTATIELTDVRTGRKEIVKHDNLVTNAVSDLLQLNPDGYLYHAGYNFAANLLPICPNAIGGVLLFEKKLDEDPAKYYASDDNPLVGYSSNDVNGTTDIMRGSMNQTESGPIDNNTGYKFVFDFETSQSNGTFTSLALTSHWGGKAGYGSELDGKSPVQVLSRYSLSYSAASSFSNSYNHWRNIVSYDNAKNIAYFAYVSAANTVEVGKIRINVLTLPSTVGARSDRISEHKTITTSAFASASNVNTRYYALLDGGDGYIWGFEHVNNANGNSSGSATVNWIKISVSDWSIQEGQWTIPEQIYMFGSCSVNTNTFSQSIKWSTIHNKFLYCLSYNRTKVFKINLSNPSDCTAIDSPSGVIDVVYTGNSWYSSTQFNVVGNVLYYPGAYILGDKAYPVKRNAIADSTAANHSSVEPAALKGFNSPGLKVGPYMLGYSVYGSSSVAVDRSVALMTPYLATINNLANPVTKTADKTMKITYILREE